MRTTVKENTFGRFAALVMLSALTILLCGAAAFSQTAAIYGQLSNFDVVNHSGHDAHGFEVELEGIQPNDIYYSFTGERYGASHVTTTATGVKVTWRSAYSGSSFDQTTIAYAGGGQFGGTCYMGGVGYATSGCEHFGVSLTAMPTATHYRWLIEDAANPGTLIPADPPVAIPNPTYIITPPAVVGEPPVLEAQIEAPEPAERPDLYGDAQWVKVFKTELTREVTLDELLTGNPIVPNDAAHTEVEWEILQDEPASNSNGNRRQRRNQGSISFGTRAVVRRYEIYNYTGAYDPITHEALCSDLTCTLPADGELGDYIGAQMAAANVTAQSVTVSKNGNGTVNSADRLIRCGADCISGYDRGAAVSLTAVADKDNIFTGWAGACTGGALTCVVNVADAMNVTANFARTYFFQVKTSGKGSINGSFGISCGRICSATVVTGSAGTITAVPEAGFRFSSWTGAACAGSGATCNLTINAATQVQANFVKQ